MSSMDIDKGSGSGGISNSSMITVNNLTYMMEPDLTVAVNATYKKHFFVNATGQPGRSNICILNSGADYVDFRRSYLSFDFALTTSDGKQEIVYNDAAGTTPVTAITAAMITNGANSVNVGFGDGSALNLISRISVNSRSGDEICRLDNVAYVSHMLTNYCYGEEWKQTVGSSIGMTKDLYLWEDVIVASQVKRRFHIPMYLLSGFFNYEKLMPSMLCSGLRIQIDFSNIKEALTMSREHTTLNTTLSYEITNLHIDAKSIQLTDSTQRLLNEMSASMGLDLVYTDINTTSSPIISTGGDQHVEVRQACSRALRAWARIRDEESQNSYLRDSYAADHWLVTAYQWRLGSLYFPQQPVKAFNVDTLTKPIVADYLISDFSAIANTPALRETFFQKFSYSPELPNAAEAHLQALEMWGKLGGKNADSSVSYEQFTQGKIPLYSHEGGPFYTSDHLTASLPAFPEITATTTALSAPGVVGAVTVIADFAGKTYALLKENMTAKEVVDLSTIILTHQEAGAATYDKENFKKGWFNNFHGLTRSKYQQPFINANVRTTDYGQYYGNHAIIPCNLERSTLFNLSGVPINNSRILGLDISVRTRVFGEIYTRVAGAGITANDVTPKLKYYPPEKSGSNSQFTHRCDVFLQYIKLARVFMNNVEIEQ